MFKNIQCIECITILNTFIQKFLKCLKSIVMAM